MLPGDFLSDLFTGKTTKRALCANALGYAINRVLEQLDETVNEIHSEVIRCVNSGFTDFNDKIKKSCMEKEANIGLDPGELKKKKTIWEQKKQIAEELKTVKGK